MSTPTLSPNTRQSACRVRGPKHASKGRGFCHTHRDASTQVTAYRPGDRTGGLDFLQTDPMGNDGGNANLYDYARQDPINGTDLTGQCWGWCWAKKALHTVKRAWHHAEVTLHHDVARPIVRNGRRIALGVSAGLGIAGGLFTGGVLVAAFVDALAAGAEFGALAAVGLGMAALGPIALLGIGAVLVTEGLMARNAR